MLKNHLQYFYGCLFSLLVTVVSPCQPPDVPVSGTYSPALTEYLAGDKIRYTCYKSLLIGSETLNCQTNGRWKGKTPFCDTPIRLKNPIGSTMRSSSSLSHHGIDGNVNTCYSTANGTGEYYRVYLDSPAIVNIVRLYLPKGSTKLKIETLRNGRREKCAQVNRLLEDKLWVTVTCEGFSEADSILVQETSSLKNILEICEMEVYVKDSSWCKEPPDVFIPNGWLYIKRDIATLQCKTGYEAGQNTRLVCEGGSWSQAVLQCEEILCNLIQVNDSKGGEWRVLGRQSKLSIGTVKQLTCDDGYVMIGDGPDTVTCSASGTWTSSSARCEKKTEAKTSDSKYKGIVIAAVAVVAIVIIVCSVLVIFLVIKKKSKPVVVVVKQSSSGSVSYNETEYSSVTYDTMPTLPLPKYPTPPTSRPPPVHMEPDYSKTVDQGPPPYVDTQSYSDPVDSKETMVKSEEAYLKTLKQSPLYGN